MKKQPTRLTATVLDGPGAAGAWWPSEAGRCRPASRARLAPCARVGIGISLGRRRTLAPVSAAPHDVAPVREGPARPGRGGHGAATPGTRPCREATRGDAGGRRRRGRAPRSSVSAAAFLQPGFGLLSKLTI